MIEVLSEVAYMHFSSLYTAELGLKKQFTYIQVYVNCQYYCTAFKNSRGMPELDVYKYKLGWYLLFLQLKFVSVRQMNEGIICQYC